MRGANRDDSTRLSEVLPREKLLCYQRHVIAMIIAITITFAMRICHYHCYHCHYHHHHYYHQYHHYHHHYYHHHHHCIEIFDLIQILYVFLGYFLF